MNAELIYKTSSPAAETWWRHVQDMQRQQNRLRRAFEDEMLATYGPADVKYGEGVGKRLLYTNGKVMTGLDAGYNERPPAGSGWRLDSKDHIWKPALREAAGREIAARLKSLTLYIWQNHVTEIGIPNMVWGTGHIYWVGLHADDDPFVLYQTWASGECEKACLAEQSKHPEIEWTEVPRSQWYARLEAREQVSA